MKITRILWVPVLGFGLMLGGCDVEQTEEGEVPDVEVEGGNVPEYDVDAADVDVTTDTQTVVTPDVDINDPDAGGT